MRLSWHVWCKAHPPHRSYQMRPSAAIPTEGQTQPTLILRLFCWSFLWNSCYCYNIFVFRTFIFTFSELPSTCIILYNKKMCCSIKTGQTIFITTTDNFFWVDIWSALKIWCYLGMYGAKHSPLNVFKMRQYPQRDRHSLPWSCNWSAVVFCETLVTATTFLFIGLFYLPFRPALYTLTLVQHKYVLFT